MRRNSRRGIAIIIVLQVLAVVLVSALALLTSTDVNSNFVRQDRRSSQAFYNAEGGARIVLKEIYDKLNGAYTDHASDPFSVVNAYHGRTLAGTIYGPDGSSVGQYSVACSVDPPTGAPRLDDPAFQQYKVITLSSAGTTSDGMRRSLNATVKVGYKFPPAFQYASYIYNYYYLNNLYCTLKINGNIAGNGDMDLFGTATPFINGNPVYDSSGAVLSMGGRTAAGTFNGVVAGWKNYGGTYAEQKAPIVPMPSLANMAYFASVAAAGTGSVRRGATTLIDRVYGQTGTKNIVLDGLSTALTINGTVVVMGDVIIRGNITGQGTLYVGGNMYIAGNLTYPTASHYSTRPTYNTASDTPEAFYSRLISAPTSWYNANSSKPAVSYCVAGNIVVGDVSSTSWWNGFTSNRTAYTNNSNIAVSPGIGGMVNGTDPNTHTKKYVDMHEDTGFDKIWGSNDSSESDGKWTVQIDNGTTVKTADLTLSNNVAQVPSGWTVVPGTGEDMDGNGRYTLAETYNDFLFRDSSGNPTSVLSSSTYTNWPGGSYTTFAGDVRDMNFPNHLDGFYFCNHLILGYLGNLNHDIDMHGGYAARQLLTLIWANTTYTMTIEQDDRITRQFGNVLPGVAAISPTSWQDGP